MSDQSLAVKSSSGTQMKKKIFRQQKVIKQDALDLFIPDPSAKTFVGVYYYMHGRCALYDQDSGMPPSKFASEDPLHVF